MRYGNVHNLDVTTWEPAKALYFKAAETLPQHGFNASETGYNKAMGRTRDRLHAAGIIIQGTNRAYLADPERYVPAMILLRSGGELPPVRKMTKPKRHKGRRPAGREHRLAA